MHGDGMPTATIMTYDCIHRGDPIGQGACNSCEGNVSLKIFRCSKHTVCTIAKRIDGSQPAIGSYMVCSGCSDRVEPTSIEWIAKKAIWLLECRQRLLSDEIVDINYLMFERIFFRDFYRLNRPVVMRGVIDWPAIELWKSPQYLLERVGSSDIEVQCGRNADPNFEPNSNALKSRMPFARFVEAVETGPGGNDIYMTANNSSSNRGATFALWNDIGRLPYLDESERGRFLWYGPAGTFTPLHHDLTNNLVVQVRGRKTVRLVAPEQLASMENRVHCYSGVKLDDGVVRHQSVEILPGDVLFIPVGWWHDVRSLDVSMTITFTNFTEANDFSSFYPVQ